MKTFQADFCFQLFLNCIIALLTFGSPFLVLLLVNFITSENRYPDEPTNSWPNIEYGVYYAIGLVVSQALAYFLTEHCFYLMILCGWKAANLTNKIVYDKHAHISSATNKEFSSGEVVNFV